MKHILLFEDYKHKLNLTSRSLDKFKLEITDTVTGILDNYFLYDTVPFDAPYYVAERNFQPMSKSDLEMQWDFSWGKEVPMNQKEVNRFKRICDAFLKNMFVMNTIQDVFAKFGSKLADDVKKNDKYSLVDNSQYKQISDGVNDIFKTALENIVKPIQDNIDKTKNWLESNGLFDNLDANIKHTYTTTHQIWVEYKRGYSYFSHNYAEGRYVDQNVKNTDNINSIDIDYLPPMDCTLAKKCYEFIDSVYNDKKDKAIAAMGLDLSEFVPLKRDFEKMIGYMRNYESKTKWQQHSYVEKLANDVKDERKKISRLCIAKWLGWNAAASAFNYSLKTAHKWTQLKIDEYVNAILKMPLPKGTDAVLSNWNITLVDDPTQTNHY